MDALVSSDNYFLTMGVGVSKAIRAAGGPEVPQEASSFVPARPGRVVVTAGGKLPARFVFHAVTIGSLNSQQVMTKHMDSLSRSAGPHWRGPRESFFVKALQDKWVVPSRDLIAELLTSCFYHADSLYVQSIAFPLLGTGAAGLSKDICLDTMFQYLARMLLRGLTCVREARIVLYE